MRVQHLRLTRGNALSVVAALGMAERAHALQAEAASSRVHTEARRTLGSPTVPTAGAVVGSSVLLMATKDDKTVKATLGMSVPAAAGVELNLFARASGPLDENTPTDPAVLGDLDGLRRAVRAALGMNLVFWNPSSDAAKQREFCRAMYTERLPDPAEKLLSGLAGTAREERRAAIVDSLVLKQCIRHNVPEARRAAFDEAGQTDWGMPILAGLTVEAGRQDVRFLDSTGTAFSKVRQSPLAATIAAGVYRPEWRTLFVLGFRAERSYDVGGAVQFCLATGQGGTLECRTVPPAEPTRGNPVIGRVEVRRFFSSFIGLSPRVSFDIGGRKAWGLELPVLLRQADDQGFTSAITLGWRSEQQDPEGPDDRIYLSAVVGATFGLGLER